MLNVRMSSVTGEDERIPLDLATRHHHKSEDPDKQRRARAIFVFVGGEAAKKGQSEQIAL